MNQIYQANKTSTTLALCVLLNASHALTTPFPEGFDIDSSKYSVGDSYTNPIYSNYRKTMSYTTVPPNVSLFGKVDSFLDFLERDIQNNPQNLQAIDSDLISYVQSLFVGEDIDIDAPIYDED